MDAALPRRTPGWPLLATLGVHLLLAWSWRIAHHPPAPDGREERLIELVPVLPPSPEAPRVRPAPPPSARAAPGTPRARSGATKTDTASAPEPITPPPEAPSMVADPFATTVPPAPAPSTLDAMVGRARRDAITIDRDMRKGKSGVPEVADTPMGRFEQALEGAYKDSGRTLASESYTAPDGQVIYRFRRGGKLWCRTGGGVRPHIGGAVGGGATQFDTAGREGSAGLIRCPIHGDWKRD